MAYIGNEPVIGQWRKLDDISGSFNGSLTNFTTQVGGVNVTAGSANQLLVSLGGVLQEPGTDYSVSSSTITFTTAPAASLSFFAVLAGDALSANTPSDGSVTTAKLGSNLTVDLDLGSAASPSLTFDADSGLFSGGDNQVAVSTSGVERVEFGASEVVFNDGGANYDFRVEGDTDANLLFVDASTDRVGIGTNSPIFTADILSGTANTGANVNNPSQLSVTGPNKGLTVGGATVFINSNSDLAADTGGSIAFTGRNTTSSTNSIVHAVIKGAKENATSTNGDGYFAVAVQNHSAGALVERMRIDSAGNVGIGTTSPGKKLEITPGSNQDGILIKNTGNVFGALDFDSNRTGANQVLGDLRFLWNGTAVARIIGESGSDTTNKDDGHLTFYTASAGSATERARIDSSGRLLVGTSSTSNTCTAVFTGRSDSSTANPVIRLQPDTNTPASGNTLGNISFSSNGTSAFEAAAWITAHRDAGTWTAGSSHPGRLVFSTTADGASSPTERMRISANGALELRNLPVMFPVTDNAVLCGQNSFRWSAVWAANGTIQTSDQRAKADIADAQLGSDFIKSLRPVSYKWIEGGKRDTGERDEDGNYIYESVPGERTHWGFIAQEVKEAVDAAGVDFGGWVLTDKDDPDSQQALRYDQFIAPLTKALQEALAEIDVLKAKVAALESA